MTSYSLRSGRRRGPRTILGVAAAALLIAALSAAGAAAQEEDWRSDWFLQPGFILEIDTLGFNLPTSIAFVPDPGPGADDPLYFVTELEGALKVVTNDRTVHTFADGFFHRAPPDEFPFLSGEVGMAGLCLAPDEGYVFVTFAYHDDNGVV